MEHVRIQLASLEFDELNYRRTLFISAEHQQHLEDVKMFIHGSPALEGGVGPLMVLLNEHDLTSAVISCLQKRLKARNQDDAKDEYKTAVYAVVNLKRRADDPNRNPDDLPDPGPDLDKADNYLEGGPLWEKLDVLGTFDEDWYGSFHIFNYLYSHVRLEPISLAEVLKDYDSRLNLKSIAPLHLTFVAQTAPGAIPKGTIMCRLDAVYHNPLDDEMEALKKRVTDLENRVALLETRVGALESRVGVLETRVGALENRVGLLENRVGALESSLVALESRVGSLESRMTNAETALAKLSSEVAYLKTEVIRLRECCEALC